MSRGGSALSTCVLDPWLWDTDGTTMANNTCSIEVRVSTCSLASFYISQCRWKAQYAGLTRKTGQ